MLSHLKQKNILSKRLELAPLMLKDACFIIELFNTEGWLTYIGDRKIHSLSEAQKFIETAMFNANAAIWTITIKEQPDAPVGIITLIKRDFLSYPDIGYALLPQAMNHGYAFEATAAALDMLSNYDLIHQIFAITLPNNKASVHLLNKLNFNFEKEILEHNELLHLYSLILKKS